jgi:hypothetical protein
LAKVGILSALVNSGITALFLEKTPVRTTSFLNNLNLVVLTEFSLGTSPLIVLFVFKRIWKYSIVQRPNVEK